MMREILIGARDAIRAGSASWMRDESIYVAPGVEYIPRAVRPPCVALSDGDIRNEFRAGNGAMVSSLYRVDIAVYSSLMRDEASILGYLDDRGLIQIVDAVHEALDENLLGISGVAKARCESESGCEMFGEPGEFLVRKIIQYSWTAIRKRPSRP